MGFPLTDPEQFPLGLGELIDLMAEAGSLRHLSLAQTTNGEWQASHKGDQGGYRVIIKKSPWEAVLGALAPMYGHPWSDVVPGLEIGVDEEEEDLL
mgnify:CR=1 FL=1|tara:strand:+ start:6979 stop:7266 length:288 start_codon:yes stop_codon:yes gene_type:complete